jgi:hypothetical protein
MECDVVCLQYGPDLAAKLERVNGPKIEEVGTHKGPDKRSRNLSPNEVYKGFAQVLARADGQNIQ